MKSTMRVVSGFLVPIVILLWADSQAVELRPSELALDMHRVRFAGMYAMATSPSVQFSADETQSSESISEEPFKMKSPLKAFLLSAAVPGAGQFYLGGKIKPAIFLGAEIAIWGFHFKYQGDGDDATNAYKAYNDKYWSRDTYQSYLLMAYQVTDDDSIPPSVREISHHLPATNTQQYYEMTGKYNQFAWGWDDARRSGLNLNEFFRDSVLQFGQGRIVSDATTPVSAHRLIYEGMRNDANNKYDKARTFTYVAIFNHVISAFEAMFSAKRHNSRGGEDSEFSSVNVKVSVKSYHSRRDTPYVKLSYKF